MRILVTGGAGYIGSHTCVELLQNGHDLVIVDNFYNSNRIVLDRIRALSGRDFAFFEADVRDRAGLSSAFAAAPVDAVIHFAGLKAVGESVREPMAYYHNNFVGTWVLCDVMRDFGVKNLVFSSSATVYGVPRRVPLRETDPVDIAGITNPYGRTKLIIEEFLRDLHASDPAWNIALLRYFNPIGAHESGLLGEDPNGIPNNLMPYISQVAVGKLPILSVFGNDYDTPDGTGVRDYIHVVDLAKGHVRAVEWLRQGKGIDAINLGTGVGYSVLELVHAFERTTGVTIPYRIAPRRAGDVAACYSDPSKALAVLGWRAELGLDRMCADTWRWQRQNPDGYRA